MRIAGLFVTCSDCNKYLNNDFIDANRRAIVLLDIGFFISLLSISDSRKPRIDSRFTLSKPEIFLGKKTKNLDKSFLYALADMIYSFFLFLNKYRNQLILNSLSFTVSILFSIFFISEGTEASIEIILLLSGWLNIIFFAFSRVFQYYLTFFLILYLLQV